MRNFQSYYVDRSAYRSKTVPVMMTGAVDRWSHSLLKLTKRFKPKTITCCGEGKNWKGNQKKFFFYSFYLKRKVKIIDFNAYGMSKKMFVNFWFAKIFHLKLLHACRYTYSLMKATKLLLCFRKNYFSHNKYFMFFFILRPKK